MTDITREQKGRRAKEILDDPVFHEAIDVIRNDIVMQWNLTQPDQSDKRESARIAGDLAIREFQAESKFEDDVDLELIKASLKEGL